MNDQPHTNVMDFATAAQRALTAAAPLPGSSTKDSNSSTDHKRAFLETFRRWEALFKRRDGGDAQAERWLIAEYYESLGHLSAEGLRELTKLLKANCTFFPTIRECLDLIKPKDRYDWGHPFLGAGGRTPPHLLAAPPSRKALGVHRVAQLEGPNDL